MVIKNETKEKVSFILNEKEIDDLVVGHANEFLNKQFRDFFTDKFFNQKEKDFIKITFELS